MDKYETVEKLVDKIQEVLTLSGAENVQVAVYFEKGDDIQTTISDNVRISSLATLICDLQVMYYKMKHVENN